MKSFALAFALTLAAFAPSARAAANWTRLARQVGESEKSRDAALAALRKTPRINQILFKALAGTDRALALDVIVALDIKSFVPELIERSAVDEDGFLILALSSMLDETNENKILSSYQSALTRLSERSPAAIVAMLEPLGRLGRRLPRATVAALFAHEWPEVRGAALYYVRLMALEHRKDAGLEHVAGALRERSFQLRAQAVFAAREIAARDAEFSDAIGGERAIDDACARESNPFAIEACKAVRRRAPTSVPPQKKAQAREEDESCQEAYRKTFAKGVVSVRMAFGYKDASPARFVGDRHERLAFVQRLLAPCLFPRDQACGFARDPENQDLFIRDLPIRPGFGSAQARVLAVNSSVGSDDDLNRADPFQKWKSRFAERAFLTGLARSEIVLYDGHSRFGGGPDFYPPKLIRKTGEVDPNAYLKERVGLKKIREVLKNRGTKARRAGNLRLIGLFSCASSQHFSDEIAFDTKRGPKVGLVSSKALMYWSDALENSLATIDAVLDMRCAKEFRAAIHQDAPISGSRLEGFF